MFPVWPHAPYAQLMANGLWADATPTSIDVHEWLADWLPGLIEDGHKVAVFPTPRMQGVVVEPARLRRSRELTRVCSREMVHQVVGRPP